MCSHILRKRSKPFAESFGTKQCFRSSYIYKCKSFDGFFHHHVEERTNTKKGITTKMPCYNTGNIGCELR
jgi:hypothetical protein